jgi:nucleotide-binding universal stress UspA family protein
MYTGLEAMEETLAELLQSDTPVAEHLRASARYFSELDIDAEMKLRRGVVPDEILREARLGDYDLIVIGPGEGDAPLRRLLVADVTPKVVERAPCPVLIVRRGCRDRW